MTTQEIIANKMEELQNIGLFDAIKATKGIPFIIGLIILIGGILFSIFVLKFEDTQLLGVVLSLVIGLLTIFNACVTGAEQAACNMVKDIVATAEEADMGDQLVITEESISFGNKAVSHDLGDNIFKAVTKSAEGNWIVVE